MSVYGPASEVTFVLILFSTLLVSPSSTSPYVHNNRPVALLLPNGKIVRSTSNPTEHDPLGLKTISPQMKPSKGSICSLLSANFSNQRKKGFAEIQSPVHLNNVPFWHSRNFRPRTDIMRTAALIRDGDSNSPDNCYFDNAKRFFKQQLSQNQDLQSQYSRFSNNPTLFSMVQKANDEGYTAGSGFPNLPAQINRYDFDENVEKLPETSGENRGGNARKLGKCRLECLPAAGLRHFPVIPSYSTLIDGNPDCEEFIEHSNSKAPKNDCIIDGNFEKSVVIRNDELSCENETSIESKVESLPTVGWRQFGNTQCDLEIEESLTKKSSYFSDEKCEEHVPRDDESNLKDCPDGNMSLKNSEDGGRGLLESQKHILLHRIPAENLPCFDDWRRTPAPVQTPSPLPCNHCLPIVRPFAQKRPTGVIGPWHTTKPSWVTGPALFRQLHPMAPGDALIPVPLDTLAFINCPPFGPFVPSVTGTAATDVTLVFFMVFPNIASSTCAMNSFPFNQWNVDQLQEFIMEL